MERPKKCKSLLNLTGESPTTKKERASLIEKKVLNICAMKSDLVCALSKGRKEEIPQVTTKDGLAD